MSQLNKGPILLRERGVSLCTSVHEYCYYYCMKFGGVGIRTCGVIVAVVEEIEVHCDRHDLPLAVCCSSY